MARYELRVARVHLAALRARSEKSSDVKWKTQEVLAVRVRFAVVVAALCFGSCAARAQEASSYTFLIASGAVCDGNDSGVCTAIAKSESGDVYELSGAGTFEAPSKSVVATGSFTHRSARGIVLETGVWVAKELVSYELFGFGPVPLSQKQLALGPAMMTARGKPLARLPMAAAGAATLRVSLFPILGPTRTGMLQVNCGLREVVHEGAENRIQLRLDGAGAQYSGEAADKVMFLTKRPKIAEGHQTPENSGTAQ